MVGLKNSLFGKRLRASYQEEEEEGPKRNRQRVNSIFGGANSSTPSLDSSKATSSSDSRGPESPERPGRENKSYGDRFVPTRDAGDMRTSYHLIEDNPPTPSKTRIIPTESDALREQANTLFTSVLHAEVAPSSPRPRSVSPVRPSSSASGASGSMGPSTPSRRRIFAYSSPSTPPSPSRRLDQPTDAAYALSPVRAESQSLLESPRRQLRTVCKTPYRVLDAPELADDFYLNLVDWSSTNLLAVGLGSCVYLWTAQTAAVNKLCDLASSSDTISSVSWVQKGSLLAVATISGRIQIYDANTMQLQRQYVNAHQQRVGALSWNSHVLTSGSRDRQIHHRDVREPSNKPFKRATGHRQEVCGLKWSGDGESGPQQGSMLASGGNDNKVCIWDLRGSRRHGGLGGLGSGHHAIDGSGSSGGSDDSGSESDVPLWKFHEHTAAVKALAWDPHVSGVLATGGGTQDKHIRFWSVFTGTMLNQLDTGSQVCNLLWSRNSHELVSTHGFSSSTAQNQICIWKYPTLNMVASLTGHVHRVLYLAMSPDGETIVTGAGDETLRFWNVFPKKEGGESRESRLDFGRLIR